MAVVAAAAGVAAGWLLRGEDTVTVTRTATLTHTVEASHSLLPEPVEQTRVAIVRAAKAHDYDALERLIPGDGFTYTYGPVAGGPIAYWRKLERTEKTKPIETLARILELPYTLNAGHFVWPFAYDKTLDELGDYGRKTLGDVPNAYVGDSYLGWRAGIEPDGTWRFYVAGD